METEYPERYKIMGLRIAYYRKKCGYTQETFAEKVGISHNFVSQIEGTGMIKAPSMEVLFKMADVLGVSPGKLLDED